MKIKDKEYAINRSTTIVTEWDNIYCQIMQDIIDRGELCENRTGIDTLSIPNVNFTIDLEKYFPILETKKMALKNTLSELLWIYQAQSNEVSWLHERNNHVWDEWMIDDDGIYRTYEPYGNEEPDKEVNVVDIDGNIIIGQKAKSKIEGKTIKSAKFFGLEYAGTIGTCYGGQLSLTKEFDKNVLNKLKNNPTDRRKNVNLLQEQFMKTAVLPTCVWARFIASSSDQDIEYIYQDLLKRQQVIDSKIEQERFKESYLPIKKETNMNILALEHLITRENPSLEIADKNNFYDFDNSEHNKDIKVKGYSSLPPIKMPIAQ